MVELPPAGGSAHYSLRPKNINKITLVIQSLLLSHCLPARPTRRIGAPLALAGLLRALTLRDATGMKMHDWRQEGLCLEFHRADTKSRRV